MNSFPESCFCSISLVFLLVLLRTAKCQSPLNQLLPPPSFNNRTGLTAEGSSFRLDGQPLKIYSGSIHYFRVPPEYWRDRLEKLKAGGLNTVSTYVPWNLHEEIAGNFAFSGILEISRFLQIAKELGLYVLLRPGPYICAEWEWGGHPSWLLQVPDMSVRSLHPRYTAAVTRYIRALFTVVGSYQHAYGGPIIAVQLENEYGSYGNDTTYLRWLADTLRANGVTEMLFTSDGPQQLPRGTLPGVYATVNGQENIFGALMQLKQFQPSRPLMVAEFWSGWFDHWHEQHHTWSADNFRAELANILRLGASVNFFMFHGGSNFGFMNGANRENGGPIGYKYQPTITSYDYDCLLDEAGRPTMKYYITRQLLQDLADVPPIPLSLSLPQLAPRTYGSFSVLRYALITDVLNAMIPVTIPELDYMEHICYGKSADQDYCLTQNFGFVAYRKTFTDADNKQPTQTYRLRLFGTIADRALLIVNGKTMLVFEKQIEGQVWDNEILLTTLPRDIVLLVENMGRVNYATNGDNLNLFMRRGAKAQMFFNNERITDWLVYPMDMKPAQLTDISQRYAVWRSYTVDSVVAQPAIYQADVFVQKPVEDTFINMQTWIKGSVFVNKFNLGRYWNVGPQQTLYLPAPRLVDGLNEVLILEMHAAGNTIILQNRPVNG